jgi:hypothetical protein
VKERIKGRKKIKKREIIKMNRRAREWMREGRKNRTRKSEEENKEQRQ